MFHILQEVGAELQVSVEGLFTLYEVELSGNSGGTLDFAGRDQCVVLWSLEDHITSIQEQPPSRSATPTGGAKSSGNAGGSVDLSNATCVYPRGIFKGHTDTVEDVQFRPSR